jgi:hypothetical protein
MSNIKIGWSEISITPDKKISLVGQFAERISQYVEKPLMATAMVIDSGDDCAILCSCDLVCVGWNLVLAVRQRLTELGAEFDVSKIILSAIHTHTGPGHNPGRRANIEHPELDGNVAFDVLRTMLESYLKPGQKYIEKENISANSEIATAEEVFALLVDRLSKVIMDAWNNRKTGSFANAFGRVAVGMCRRAAYSDGSAQMWGDTNKAVFTELEGGNDSGMELIYVFDENKKLTGVVANLACPAQCVQHRLFVSPDFWGEVKVRLRKHFGEELFVLPQCSAAGDQCPVDLIRWVEPESDINDPNCKRTDPPKRKADPSMFDLAGMYRVGRRIANEIIQVWEDGLDEAQSDVVFEHRVVDIPLPLRRATLTDVQNAKRAIRDYVQDKDGDIDYNDVAHMQVHLGILKRFEIQDKMDNILVESHFIRLGSIAIATNPFELFLDYGNQIKARSVCEQTFLIQLANGSDGYLPTAKAEAGGHYSAFLSSGQVGHVGGEMLVRQTLDQIRDMFK